MSTDAYRLGFLLADGDDLVLAVDRARRSGRFGRGPILAELRISRALLELIDHGYVRTHRGRITVTTEARA